MLDAAYSVKAAHRALRVFLPEEEFALASLKDPTKLYDTWVFRCKLRGKNTTFVCKLSTPDAQGRAKISNQYDRLKSTHANLKNPLLTTPQALAFVENECALIMEHVKGDSLQHLLPQFSDISEASPYLRQAGRWISSFQQSTMKSAAFDAKPHMNWLMKKLERHQEKSIVIPDYDAFMVHFHQLEQRAAEAQARPSLRCVTHRDFHLGNLIFGRKGLVYGIDFENKKEDDALRDVVSFLFDFMMKWRGNAPGIAGFQTAAAGFWEGYADHSTAPTVLEFFQKFSALNGWSGLEARKLADQNKQQRLESLKQLAETALLDIAR
ncbi:MAG: aminoglycoside phosphotransferase family protein [Cypionkella sp.]|uniref:phosphotransferase family protein n=1 Tax=Cypionkella sp. TaxID=2811411 RepID=UPI002AB863B3|nr:aminoglycoside phosphotransferase family protein [Cypionkella sp.]MDZ4313027.1 aminoglycoside phosphotransferase family protein [Cypionkella sp.]